jgi:hypothetical protein
MTEDDKKMSLKTKVQIKVKIYLKNAFSKEY